MKSTWKTYGLWILLAEGVGALSGWLTREGMEVYKNELVKPPLSPPGIVFPIVWGILFALMGIGAAKVWLARPTLEGRKALCVFGLQLGFNFFWSIWFFNLQWFGFALAWLMALWGLILWMIFLFCEADSTAGWLQVPYFLWVTFAAYLNFGVWRLN